MDHHPRYDAWSESPAPWFNHQLLARCSDRESIRLARFSNWLVFRWMYISVSFSMRRSRMSQVTSSLISWLSGGLKRKNGTLMERHHASALSTARMRDSVTFRNETNTTKYQHSLKIKHFVYSIIVYSHARLLSNSNKTKITCKS